jgi:drug/metabolite transporter (DMT)-like permease
LLAVFNSLWTISVALTGAAIATVLVCCSPVFTALLGRWLLQERLDGTKLLAVALSLIGCVLIAGVLGPAAGRADPLGVLTGTLSALGYAIYSLMGRSAAQRGLNAAARPAELLWLGDALAGWGILFMLAAGPTLAGFGLYNVSLTYLPSSVANLIATSEPAFTAVIAYLLLGERLSGMEIAGSAMVLAGVVLLRVTEGRQTDPNQSGSHRAGEVAPTG